MIKFKILLFIVVLLSGCQRLDAKRDISTYGPYCEELGHEPNTEAWANCIQLAKAGEPSAAEKYRTWKAITKD